MLKLKSCDWLESVSTSLLMRINCSSPITVLESLVVGQKNDQPLSPVFVQAFAADGGVQLPAV